MRDIVTNFAATTLSVGFGVTGTTGATRGGIPAVYGVVLPTGAGARFPTAGNFLISIDTEILLVSPPAAGTTDPDVLPIVARGQEGTTAMAHASGTVVQQAITAGMLNHLWQNVPDRFNPDVPPAFAGGIASVWDDEFEAVSGLWTQYPNDTGCLITPLTSFSWLTAGRAATVPTTPYWYYQTFAPSGAWTVTARASHACQPSLANGAMLWLTVADSSNPTGSQTSGNRIRVGIGQDPTILSTYPTATSCAILDAQVYSSGSQVARLFAPDIGYHYLRLSYNGSTTVTLAASLDGVCYTTLVTQTLALVAQSIAFGLTGAGSFTFQTAQVDWLRVTQP